jgi:putative phosphoribosyl transferase
VTAHGGRFLNEEMIRELEVSDAYLQAETGRRSDEACQREARMRGGASPIAARGRTVILVDDGLATGATMRAVVRSVKRAEPSRIIVAVPIGSRQACEALRSEVDEVAWVASEERCKRGGVTSVVL